jgi:hypothetical protein
MPRERSDIIRYLTFAEVPYSVFNIKKDEFYPYQDEIKNVKSYLKPFYKLDSYQIDKHLKEFVALPENQKLQDILTASSLAGVKEELNTNREAFFKWAAFYEKKENSLLSDTMSEFGLEQHEATKNDYLTLGKACYEFYSLKSKNKYHPFEIVHLVDSKNVDVYFTMMAGQDSTYSLFFQWGQAGFNMLLNSLCQSPELTDSHLINTLGRMISLNFVRPKNALREDLNFMDKYQLNNILKGETALAITSFNHGVFYQGELTHLEAKTITRWISNLTAILLQCREEKLMFNCFENKFLKATCIPNSGQFTLELEPDFLKGALRPLLDIEEEVSSLPLMTVNRGQSLMSDIRYVTFDIDHNDSAKRIGHYYFVLLNPITREILVQDEIIGDNQELFKDLILNLHKYFAKNGVSEEILVPSKFAYDFYAQLLKNMNDINIVIKAPLVELDGFYKPLIQTVKNLKQ